MDVAQLVEPRVVIPVVVGSSPIVHPRYRAKLLPAKVAAEDRQGAAGKSPGAGRDTKCAAAEVTVAGRVEPRPLPAVGGVMSVKIAAGDFRQMNKGR